jgi:hypothetical protein
MRYLTLICALVISVWGNSQIYLDQMETVPCGLDSVDILNSWEAYQTADNTWSGPRDSSICINLAVQSYNGQIDMDEIDIQRPVFMRYRGPDVALNEDMIYFLGLASSNFDSIIDLGNQEFCNNDFCTGSLIGIEIPAHPDSTNATDMRWYNSELDSLPNNLGDVYCSYTHCIPTEFFQNGNVLKEIVFKFMFDTTYTGVFQISDIIFDANYGAGYLPEYFLSQDQFTITTDSWGEPMSYLVDYPGEEYPSEYQYIDLLPSPNVDTVSTIEVIFNEMDYILFQPYIDFRGGLVEGEDSLRHAISIINSGATFCLNGTFIDVIFNELDRYVHLGGELDFKTQRSCMQFKPGSELRVGQGVDLRYGDDGHGTLAIYPKAEVVLERDASLLLNNRMVIYSSVGQEVGSDVVIDILPSTKVVLGKNFDIINYSLYQESKLVFNMLGGYADVSRVDSETMQHIEFRYPSFEIENTVEILGNPIADILSYRYERATSSSIHELIDIQGRSIVREKLSDQKGINYREIDMTDIPSGIYLLTIEMGDKRESHLIIKD